MPPPRPRPTLQLPPKQPPNPPPDNSIAATFGPNGGTKDNLSLKPITDQVAADGGPVAALSASVSPAVLTPQSFTLTVPAAGVPDVLKTTVNGKARLDAKTIEDILLIIAYS